MVKIKARAIIEIAGFPKEHVEETMIKVVENLKKDFPRSPAALSLEFFSPNSR